MQVIIAGAPDAAETQALMAAAHGVFAPDRVVLPIDPSNAASKAWFQKHNPEALAMIEGASKEVGSPLVVVHGWVCEARHKLETQFHSWVEFVVSLEPNRCLP